MTSASHVERTFLRALTFSVSVAALLLAFAEEARWPASLTPLIAVLSYIFVDRKRLIRLPVMAANVLGVVAFAVVLREFWLGDLVGKLLSGAHLLVYMTWIVLLLRKGIRQFWWLLGLCILQLAIASVLTNNPRFGSSLIGMLLVLIWTLALFTLYRAQQRVAMNSASIEDSLNAAETTASVGATIRNGLQIDSNERWIGWHLRGIVAFAWSASIVVGVFAFVVFPRVRIDTSTLAGAKPRGFMHQTGYSRSVELGEIGQILQTDGRVMQFEIERVETGQAVTPEDFAREMKMDEILFRGHVLAQYTDGRWEVTRRARYADRNWRVRLPLRNMARASGADFRMRITQDPPVGRTAFTPLPMTNAAHVDGGEQSTIEHQVLRHSVHHAFRQESREASPLTYDVWCQIPETAGAIHRKRQLSFTPSIFDFTFNYDTGRNFVTSSGSQPHNVGQHEYNFTRDWFLTPELTQTLPDLSRIAHDVCSEDGVLVSERERCSRVVRYLSSPANFQYSLKADVVDKSIDPIEDFLVNRRTGHCEYFASACALMLQAVDVPARIVNGYKGSEVNSVSGRAEVKQFHGHTWAEAWVEGNWTTLDPTPVSGRSEAVTRRMGQMSWLADWQMVLHDGWYEFLGIMSPERQEGLVAPLINSAETKFKAIKKQGIWASFKAFVLDFIRNPSQWISWRGWVMTFVVLLPPALLMKRNPFARMAGFFRSGLGWLRHRKRQQRSVVRFYENFRNLCSAQGLPLPSHHTAQENANAASIGFAEFLTHPDDRSIPARVAAAFNSVRFGNETLSEEAIERVRQDVKRFQQLLTSRTGPRRAKESHEAV